MPPPIAHALLAEALDRFEPDILIQAFIGGPPRLFASFAHRLGLLHHVPRAVTMAERLLGAGEILGEPALLDGQYKRAFLKLAPAAPAAILCALERTVAGPNADAFIAPGHSGRRDYGELLVHVAYDQALFARAMNVLLAFVLAEGGDEGHHSLRALFLERFWIVLSFTQADAATRLAYIDALLDDDRAAVRALGVEALDHMIDASQFSSSFDANFGARPRNRGWQPSGIEQTRWFEAALDRLIAVGGCSAPEAGRARTIVAHHVREHVGAGYGDLILAAVERLRGTGYWDEAWDAVSETLSFDRAAMGDHLRDQVEALERSLRPGRAADLFEAFVLGEPWRHWHPAGRENHSVRDVGLLARALGRSHTASGALDNDYLDRALRVTGYSSVREFGEGIASVTPDVPGLWDELLARYRAIDPGERNPTLLAGFLKKAAVRDAGWVNDLLDAVVDDPALSADLVFLHPTMALGSQAIGRFSQALASGSVPPRNFQGLMYGGATRSIPAAELAAFLRQLYAHEDGAMAALQVLYMRLVADRSAARATAPELVALCRELVADPRTFEAEHASEEHGIAVIAAMTLEGEQGHDVAVAICQAIRAGDRSNRRNMREFDKVCALVTTRYPRVVLDEILLHDGLGDSVVGRFFGSHARDRDVPPEGIAQIDHRIALDWVAEDPDARAPRLATFIPYSMADSDAGGLIWTPLARALIEEAPNPVSVLLAFERRFWSGSGNGSFATRFVRRRPLLDSLAGSGDRAVRNWVRAAQARLEQEITRWERRDREPESRFE
ncbi:MAG: hypothetical protein JWR80_7496 [Bradyrhizobium sp.]|nr:hypothetical protein [Bradyrhizobium sp.]